MELMQGTSQVSKFEPQDFISRMPDNVVSNILDRLPLQEAMRTGILARDWRFKWTMLSQLVFDDNFYEYMLRTQCETSYARIVSTLLLRIQGAITKFVFYIENKSLYLLDGGVIEHWILLLSGKGIKDLTFYNQHGPLKLPTHLFSCLELKRLNLYNCCFNPPSNFHGFPNLLSLEWHHYSSRTSLPTLLFYCLELKHLKLVNCCFDPPHRFRGFPNLLSLKLRSVEAESWKLAEFFTKCPNLKRLTLCLYYVRNMGHRNVFDIVGSLSKLQELDLDFSLCEYAEDGHINRLPVIFSCLKTLKLSSKDKRYDTMLLYAFEMIRSFPNLQTLEITGRRWDWDDDDLLPAVRSPRMSCNGICQLQLRSIVFIDCQASKNEICLIRYLLACSPFLKEFIIRPASFLKFKKKYMFARKLLKLHRASPVVDIDLF